MAILQVCAFGAPSPGNFIAALTALENCMKERGIETIYAFAETAKGRPWCDALCQRAKVYFLPVAKARILPKTYQVFRKIYRENTVEIIHTHFELYDIPATVTAPKSAKIFWHLHDPIKQFYIKGPLSRKFLTKFQYSVVAKRTDGLLSVSNEHAAFVSSLGFPSEKIQLCPNGINTNNIHKVTPGKDIRFLMFGWDVYRKGVDLAVSAVQTLSYPPCIWIVGLDACKSYLSSVNAPSIRYLSPVSDVNVLYQEVTAFLHISRAEGQSYALLEAIYAGLPVICSDIPENEFARQFRNVTFVSNENVPQIASALQSVAQSQPPCNCDISYNRAIIDSSYSLQAWCHTIAAHYGV